MKSKKILSGILGALCALGLLFVVDRLLDVVLTRTGYFKALIPKIVENYNTGEFTAFSRISSQGLRNEEVMIPKPETSFRILALGDSFTYGWGVNVEDSWPKLLENKLTIPGKTVEVINAGVPGANIRDIRFVCRAYQDRFDVDVIAVGFYLDNLYQAAARWSSIHAGIRTIRELWPTLTKVHEPILGVHYWGNIAEGTVVDSTSVWKSDSAEFIRKYPGIPQRMDPSVWQIFVTGKVNPGVYYLALSDPLYAMYLLSDRDLAFALESTKKSMARFGQRCARNGVPVVVIFIPSQEVVSTYYHPYKEAFGYVMDQKLVTVPIDNHLEPIIESYGYTYISVLDNFRSDGCTSCYYPYDSHFTKEGNIRLADIVAPSVQQVLDSMNHE